MNQESEFDKSYRINHFAQPEDIYEKYKYYDNECEQSIEDLKIDETKIHPIEITSISKYIKEITEIINEISKSGEGKAETDVIFKNPLYYRVHSNINFFNCPSALRGEEKIEDENILFSEFVRRYPEQFIQCKSNFERLVLMQHYGSFSRLLDLTYSPLATLGFACIQDGKFQLPNDRSRHMFASVTLFRAPEKETHQYLKFWNSETVSVLSTTALMNRKFRYEDLAIEHNKDGFANYLNDFIYFRDIIRRSIIVRAPLTNPRIKNQKGAFILVNSNEINSLNGDSDLPSSKKLTEKIIEKGLDEKYPINLTRLRNNEIEVEYDLASLKTLKTGWDIEFKKINPYSLDNKIKQFREDPFNLEKLYYRNKDGKRPVFFIPPNAKERIRKELETLGFGYDSIYPEIDTVFHEVVNKRL